jgi:hypothetical protein
MENIFHTLWQIYLLNRRVYVKAVIPKQDAQSVVPTQVEQANKK